MNLSGKLTYYTSPPEVAKVSDTKLITEFSPGFDIDALLSEENTIIEKMDDTKLLVDGMEVQSNEPFKVNFEELDKDSDVEEESDGETYEINDDEMVDESNGTLK